MKARGFSLLEVMIAVAILAFALLGLINFQSQSMVIYGRAEKVSQATFLARAKMAELLLQFEKEQGQQGSFPEDKEESGTFEKPNEQFKWKWVVRKVAIPAPAAPPGGENAAMTDMMRMVVDQVKEQVREVKLTVSWEELGKEQSFDVVTHVAKL